jgi:hypothetical protein
MSIPNTREPSAPPPLPPPKFPDLDTALDGEPDIAWRWSNSREEAGWGRPSLSVNPGSSLYGSFRSYRKSIHEERPEYTRHGSLGSSTKSTSAVDTRIDEGYQSLSGTSVGSNQLVTPFWWSFCSKSRCCRLFCETVTILQLLDKILAGTYRYLIIFSF